MIGVLIRFAPSVIALIFIFVSYVSWTYSTPPTWTIFLPRTETVVLATEVKRTRIGNGTYRNLPIVTVTWPPGSERQTVLGAVTPDFFGYGPSAAADVVKRYPVGAVIGVRDWNGQPYASDAGWFGPLHSVLMSLFTAMLCGIAWVFFVAMGPARRR